MERGAKEKQKEGRKETIKRNISEQTNTVERREAKYIMKDRNQR